MPAPPEIIDLVKRFDQYHAKYTSPSYNESQVRKEFIDPFFEALGWDVNNRSGLDERYKDVIHEDTVKVETSTRAPDYSFRIGGIRKFFVEAKKPSVNLKEDPEPAYQVRRYAWSAKLPVSLLTDFEEFIVYDCTAKPSPKDKASVRRIGYYHYTEYIEKWDEIAAIFSKQGILTGGYDDYVESLKQKKGGRGTASIDDAFLAEIEGWREILAKNIALRNKDLSVRELNAAVQKTIDRIIFLRICEDRGIEKYEQLRMIAAGKDIYEQLKSLFLYADEKYNSGLFHFSAEPGREDPDTLTLSLSIDDRVLKQIITHLYYPDSPYEFSVFPADILGQVYEQFLGKVIRLTAGHQAKVEEKPEVKKAGGVFYTPTYIVEYIVKQTVGSHVEGKDPKAVVDLHVLDPACGSGSFLLGAYQYLLDWHLAWYMDNLVPLLVNGAKMTDPAVLALLPVKPAPVKRGRGKKGRGNGDKYFLPVYQMTDTDWRLTTEEKKRILVNNIYGVDIDPQAVEVTKLSLLLKVLEGEKSERISKQLTITQERVLPSLHNNIKCGNSLIGPDIYNDVQVTLDDAETIFRINAFDWNRAFPAIMQAGGFDAVIGNPPYVRMEEFKDIKDYLKQHYSAHEERSDLYTYFVEKGHNLVKESGCFGMIFSNKFLKAKYGKPLREYLAKEARIENVVDLAGLPVFPNATVRTLILISQRTSEDDYLFEYTPPLNTELFEKVSSQNLKLEEAVKVSSYALSSDALHGPTWTLINPQKQQLFGKIMSGSKKLSQVYDGQICMGIKSGATAAFTIDSTRRSEIISKNPEADEIIKPFLNGKDIRRYNIQWDDKYIIYTYHGVDIAKYPEVFEHLKLYQAQLKWRATKQEWYELQQPQYKYVPYFEGVKIIFPDISKGVRFALDINGYYSSNTTYFIPTQDRYVLGLLNSKLAYFCFSILCAGLEGKYETYLRFFGQYLEEFPIRIIDFSNSADVARHDRMVALVEQMLDLNKRLVATKTSHERAVLARMVNAVDTQIDRLVYELYELTEEEIAVVEG